MVASVLPCWRTLGFWFQFPCWFCVRCLQLVAGMKQVRMHQQVWSYLEVGRKDGGWAGLGSPLPWCWVEVVV